MMGKILFPALNQTRRNRLCADMHQSQLVKIIILQLNISTIKGVQNILCPRNQQPYDRAFLLRNSVHNIFRLRPFQQDCLRACQEASKPVHLSTGMVQWRNTQENIIPCLPVMVLLYPAGMHQALMVVQDRLGKACCSG